METLIGVLAGFVITVVIVLIILKIIVQKFWDSF